MRASRTHVLLVVASSLVTVACSSSNGSSVIRTASAVAAPAAVVAEDDVLGSDMQELVTALRQDLTLSRHREKERIAASALTTPARQEASTGRNTTSPFDRSIATRRIVMGASIMPVAGVRTSDLVDTWGAPRDGGRRSHRGIDIFAPRGTEIFSMSDGVITYIGEQPKGGKCLWVSTEDGLSFYYAHLDRWAPGLYEGMAVSTGTVLGYVGNTGNARSTPAHLHLAVHEAGEAINPYSFLKYGRSAASSQRTSARNASFGGR